MNLFKYLKYAIRFVFLQTLITFVTIWFFDNYVFLSDEHKFSIYQNLVDDRTRFYSFVPLSWITIDVLLALLIFIFLVILFFTKFYTYVNELDFTYDSKYIDDYVMLYLMWNSFMFSSLYVFRISGLSRGNLMLFTFIVPFILFFFRNSEMISLVLGRSVSKENYISFNLDSFSNFRNLRIISYRNEKQSILCSESKLTKFVMEEVDLLNKKININLVVINLTKINSFTKKLEHYLVNLNKKVLIISKKELQFNVAFIYRVIKIDNTYVYYFNNDIQYGSKYILKRLFDISISLILIILLSPFLVLILGLIVTTDSFPGIIKQARVGQHGKIFNMYKFRTMYKNSHEKRVDLENLNKNSGPLFKIKHDPRIINRLNFLRKYSLDELPQLFNVLKGDMSLVGPRPLFEEDTKSFDQNYMRRLNVLPGMTGLLQINDRNTPDFEIWYKYDLEYIENWSLFLDIKILLKTIKAIKVKKNSGL